MQTIERTEIDTGDHPELVAIELCGERYHVSNYFWDGVQYQRQAIGNHYGSTSLVYAQKAYTTYVMYASTRQGDSDGDPYP